MLGHMRETKFIIIFGKYIDGYINIMRNNLLAAMTMSVEFLTTC